MRAQSKYNASLLAANGLSDTQRQAAEKKFLEVLESALGGPSAVRGAYCECLAVRSLSAENPFDTRTPEELQAVARWDQAAQAATQIVFSQLKIPAGEAVFELHVWNSRTN